MMKYFLILIVTLFSFITYSQSIEGVWKTYDDSDGQLKSEVELYIKDGKLYGKIIKLHNLDIPYEDAICKLCNDSRKNKHVQGMEIISGLQFSGKEWSGNKKLLDPNNGKLYDAKFWLENDNKLAVRGYLGWFYRTQYWVRK
ncbi:MAG TPA: DUF2147 domain-containing protein [Brumimicrobium sp.]|nr:DUF2147 domain-containing protein [Brumimicrobium sp.]